MTKLLRNKKPGFRQLTFNESEFSPICYYASGRVIDLHHGEKLILDGYITNHMGKESEYFKQFLQNNGIQDLVEKAQEWDGAWSIIYINKNGVVYCFTDPLGKKQLYYNSKGEIASTITPLLEENPIPDEVYQSKIGKWGYNTDDRTPWQDISRVTPNLVYVFIGGVLQTVSLRRYFDFRWKGEKLNPKAFRELVSNSVRGCLDSLHSCKSIAVLLSGGLDSSIIAFELLQAQSRRNFDLHFYSVNNADDDPYIEIFCAQYGIHTTRLNYDMNRIDLKSAVSINETPVDLGSMVPTQIMFGSVKEKVLFTGDGPDELFGGYRRINEYDSQKSDIFEELSYYHLPRLERAASHFGIELRCPWLSYDVVRYALSLPYSERKNKTLLKEAYKDYLPKEIIQREKTPLKNELIKADPAKYRHDLVKLFYKKGLYL